jgi:hypothetical protein
MNSHGYSCTSTFTIKETFPIIPLMAGVFFKVTVLFRRVRPRPFKVPRTRLSLPIPLLTRVTLSVSCIAFHPAFHSLARSPSPALIIEKPTAQRLDFFLPYALHRAPSSHLASGAFHCAVPYGDSFQSRQILLPQFFNRLASPAGHGFGMPQGL